MVRSAEEIPSNTTTTPQVAVAVGHKTDTNTDNEKHLISAQAGNTMRCQWIYVKQGPNTEHQCQLPGVGEATTKRNLILSSAHLPAASKRISVSLSSRERWSRHTPTVSSLEQGIAMPSQRAQDWWGLLGLWPALCLSSFPTSLEWRRHREACRVGCISLQLLTRPSSNYRDGLPKGLPAHCSHPPQNHLWHHDNCVRDKNKNVKICKNNHCIACNDPQ